MGLFNTVYYNHTTKSVPYEKSVTVHEHRAPTDVSIKIYDEMLEKTKNRVLGVFKIESNLVKCVVIAMQNPNFCSVDLQNIKYFVRFELNGELKEFSFDIDAFELNTYRESYDRELLEKIINKISEYIAMEILKTSTVKTTKIGFKQDYTL